MKRVERAQLAADWQRLSKQSETQHISDHDDDNIGQDMEIHHKISKSRKDAVSIYSYVCENHGDPAFKVCLHVLQTYPGGST